MTANPFGDLCCEEVNRRGELQPCDRPAVALRYDPREVVAADERGTQQEGKLMNLTEFLLARIAEDEAAAGEPDRDDEGWGTWRLDPSSFEWPGISPRRVLAECEAKRRIVAEWMEVHDPNDPDGPCGCDPATGPREMYEVHDGHADALSVALRALALPYADHPDYQQEWRP